MNKTILITAGAKRLGKVFAEEMIKKNWSIALHYNKSKMEAEETAHNLVKNGGNVSIYHANFLDIDQTEKFIKIFAKENQDWIGVINNAGLFNYDLGDNFDYKKLHDHLMVNFCVPSLLIKALYKKLKSSNNNTPENIAINILDAKLFGLNPDYYTYTLSKQSMHGLTKMAALSYAPILRVNGIAPGITLPASGQNNNDFKKAYKNNLLKRSSSIKELEQALSFLVNSPSVTGHVLLLDGGAHLSPPRRDVSLEV